MVFNFIGNFALFFCLILSLIIFATSILNLNNKNSFFKRNLNELLFFKFFFTLLSFFKAEKILAKHDENYMPPEVKASLGEN